MEAGFCVFQPLKEFFEPIRDSFVNVEYRQGCGIALHSFGANLTLYNGSNRHLPTRTVANVHDHIVPMCPDPGTAGLANRSKIKPTLWQGPNCALLLLMASMVARGVPPSRYPPSPRAGGERLNPPALFAAQK